MKLNQFFNISLTATLLGALVLSTGCQSGAFKKPDLGKLAFWKKDDLRLASRNESVPPPSAHFNPDRGEEPLKGKEQLQASVDAIIAEAKRNKENLQDPIRKPYSLDLIDSKISKKKATEGANDFVLSQKLNQIQSKTNNAIKATENTISQAGAIAENTANSFAGLKSSFKSEGESKISQVATGLKNQAGNAISSTSEAVGSLATTTKGTIDRSVSSVSNAIDNSFQSKSNASTDLMRNPYMGPEKSAAATSAIDNPLMSEAAIASNDDNKSGVNFLRNRPDNSAVQQSSFDSSINKTRSAILQPVSNPVRTNTIPDNGTAAPTSYPTTSFGTIQANNGSQPSTSNIQVPPQLLRGTSSFAPGSTTPLRPVN